MNSPALPTSLRSEEIALLVSELSVVLPGQRVGKVFDAPHGNIRIVIGSGARKLHLLISVHPSTSRMILESQASPAPDTPGEMVTRLRSLLTGALINAVDQPGGDRVMRLRLSFGKNKHARRDVVLEMFGRMGRLLVVEGKPTLIRFVTGRGGLGTGEPYQYPQAPEPDDRRIPGGVSPTLPFEPLQLLPIESRGGDIPYHHWLAPQLAEREEQLLLSGQMRQRHQELNRQEKILSRRLGNLESDLGRSLDWESFQQKGELLKTALSKLKRGMAKFEVEDWYQEGSPMVEISLIPEKTPIQNVEKYFHKARKGKRSIDQLTTRCEQARHQIQEIVDLRSEGESLQQDDEIWVQDLVDSWCHKVDQWSRKFGKKRQQPPIPSRKGRKKTVPRPFQRFRSREGFEILVGRSARENDDLSIRTASGNDLFFHIAGKPGPHVILRVPRGSQPSPESIEDAAYVAAHRSGWRGPGGVAVHWTEAKYVRKPKGLPPGKVFIDREREHWVSPRDEGLAGLQAESQD